MFRVVHVLLTIIGMVACPFFCLTGNLRQATGRPARAEIATAASCPCCKHAAPPSDNGQRKDSPGTPTPTSQCTCPCICKGAIVGSGSERLADDLGQWMALVSIPDAVAGGAVAYAPTWQGATCPPGDPPSGCSMRIRLGSLLI